jgi:Ca2+-binding EF-hand superfamily protein
MSDPPTNNMLDDNSPSIQYGARVESENSKESFVEPTVYDMDTYRIVFELFDRDGNGYIEADDLAVISSKLGRDPQEVFSIIRQFDENRDDKVSFQEFVNAMNSIENQKPKTFGDSPRRKNTQSSFSSMKKGGYGRQQSYPLSQGYRRQSEDK